MQVPATVTSVPTTVLTNVYDANSRRTQQTATISGTADFKNTWAYDNANRLTQVKQESQSGGNTVAAKRDAISPVPSLQWHFCGLRDSKISQFRREEPQFYLPHWPRASGQKSGN